MVLGIDTSVLLSYYQSKTGQTVTSSNGSTTGSTTPAVPVPTAPWNQAATSSTPTQSSLVTQALAGKNFINPNATQLDVPGASVDYSKLFTTYQALNTLSAIVAQAGTKNISNTQLASLQKAFNTGLGQTTSYVDSLKLAQLRLTNGTAMTSDEGTVGVQQPNISDTYTTGTLFSGTYSDLPPQFQGNVAFNVQVKRLGVTTNVSINLAGMNATPRTFGAVVNYMNSQMAAAGVHTKFASQVTPAAPRTVTVGGQSVTLPSVGDAFALQVVGDGVDQLSFTAANAAPAVYIASQNGNPDPDKDPTTKDGVLTGALSKTAAATAGTSGSQAFNVALDPNVTNVRSTQTGADGSVYVLADVTKSVAGQTLQGSQDVALQKYDSAGKLVYTRTLGASDSASGLALAVSASGQVAIAGSVTGGLQGATDGPLNSSDSSGNTDKTDSFVTLYDANGDEVWTQVRGAQANDQAQAVAIGDDGVVYVAGQTQGAIPSGGGAVAGNGLTNNDNYLMGIGTTAAGAPKTLFTTQFGSANNDSVSGLVVNGGQVIVAGQEGADAVLRSFGVATTGSTVTKTSTGSSMTVTTNTYANGVQTGSTTQNYTLTIPVTKPTTTTTSAITSATVTAGAVRDLGDLKGGTLAGLALDNGDLYVGGSTRNAALGLSGSVGNGYSGGLDAFAGKLSTDLSDTSQDALTYLGGAGDEKVSGMAVTNGQVWMVGKASADFPAGSAISTSDGFLAGVDLTTGALVASQRLTGKDGYVDNAKISIDPGGASDLDKFGLPTGSLVSDPSQLLVANTSLRAGDSFQVRTQEGGSFKTITIAANETVSTLAQKITSATGYAAQVKVLNLGAGKVLQIQPANSNSTIELAPGPAGSDALNALGLPDGVVRKTVTSKTGATTSADGGGAVFGLNLATGYDLSDPTSLKAASDAIGNAITQVQAAYQNLVNIANPPPKTSTAAGADGPVPAYLTNEIANYQAALTRLTAGNSSPSAGIASLL